MIEVEMNSFVICYCDTEEERDMAIDNLQRLYGNAKYTEVNKQDNSYFLMTGQIIPKQKTIYKVIAHKKT